jgi:sterol desaturase/sphingolipid hydroxylase (fatty acid hydroxylase superfamily)
MISPAVVEARPRRARRWPTALMIATLAAAAIAINRGALVALPLLFVVVVPCERLFPRHQQRLRRPGLATDIAYFVSQPVLRIVGIAVGVAIAVASLAWLPGLLLRPLVHLLPAVPRTVLGILLFDMASYWGHRWSHEIPFIWRFHSIHHSSEQLDWVSGIRAHPFDGGVIAPVFVFLVAAGFSPRVSGALAGVQLVTGVFLHANVRWRWRPLQRVVNTPELHHWHHANEPDALNKNYAILLPVWDLLFGTYFMPPNRRPQVYGVTQPLPVTLMGQILEPLRGLRNPLGWFVHPVVELRILRRNLRRGRQQLVQSTLRPTRPPATA